MRILLLSFTIALFALAPSALNATTWDEPWQDKVMKEAEHFVLARVKKSDEEKGITIDILKTLGGSPLEGTVEVTDFYMLDLCSSSSGHGPEFHFEDMDSCYFFLKKNSKGKLSLPTPTAGFAYIIKGKVYATYRHSYHQALVRADIYERTMTAIYNNYHGQKYDTDYINKFIDQQLSKPPAGLEGSEAELFFMQHVALELIYHLKLDGKYKLVIPSLFAENFHAQVSAARALSAYNTVEAKNILMEVIADTSKDDFVRVIAVWSLQEMKPKELKEKLKELQRSASDEDTGFGGNIMDPRVCTRFPSLRSALEGLIEKLE